MTPRTHAGLAFGPRVRAALVVAGTATITCIWVVALVVSGAPLGTGLMLVVLQAALASLALWMLLSGLPSADCSSGYGIVPLVALHVLIHYSISNVVPALLADIRASIQGIPLLWVIPEAGLGAYCLGTLAALLFLIGVRGGSVAAQAALPVSSRCTARSKGTRRFAWLPSGRLAMIGSIAILAVAGIGSARYGLQWTTLLTQQDINALPMADKALFHGLLYFMPAVPLLASAACAQATTRRGLATACLVLVATAAGSLVLLMVWRMRSSAMMSLAAPILLLIYTGRLRWRRAVMPAAVLVVVAYVAVTVVRVSALPELVRSRGGVQNVAPSEVLAALGQSSGYGSISSWVLLDASYRTAGLEGVAAIVEAQGDGRLPLKYGTVTWAGFMQALPAALRSPEGYLDRVKTAPSQYGVFRPGDWVSTILAEQVLDAGPLLVLLSAVVVGFVVEGVDRVLLRLSAHASLRGLLALRLAWAFQLVVFEWGLADVMVLFAKATVGYTALLLGLTAVARLRLGLTYSASVRARVSEPVGHDAAPSTAHR